MGRAVALVDPAAALVTTRLGQRPKASNARLREVLGIEPRPGPEAAVAMATSLIELGAV